MTTTTQTPRLGVIGVGVVGRTHIARLTAPDSPARLVAVADAVPAASAALGEEYGVTAAESVDALLARDDIDAVVVAIPSGLHADTAVAALEAGKHVLLEKPIDVTVAAADRIIEAERRSGKVLTVMSQRRFAAENEFIREAIRSGALGRVTSATVEVALWRTQEYFDSAAWRGTWALDGGGALMNQGVHLVDLALWLLGDVEEVYAHTGLLSLERIEVEDTVTFTARMASGALITFLATTTAYGNLPIRMSVIGDGGVVVTESERITHYASATAPELPAFEPVDQQRAQLDDFLAAIAGGTRPRVESVQARAAVSLIEAVYESGRTGSPVRPR